MKNENDLWLLSAHLLCFKFPSRPWRTFLHMRADSMRSLEGHRGQQRLLSLLVNHCNPEPDYCTRTHKSTWASPLRSRNWACKAHHSVKSVKSDEKCHRRIIPHLALSWVTTSTVFKVHPSFLLPFFYPEETNNLTRWGQVYWGMLSHVGWLTDWLFTWANSSFKENGGGGGGWGGGARFFNPLKPVVANSNHTRFHSDCNRVNKII